MKENKVRTIWAEGGTVLNGWLAAPSSVTAEVMARQDWDSVTLDLQHGLVDYPAAVTMLQAISQTETVPLARAPWNEPVLVQKLLDAGAYGIICPMVNSREEAERFVGACRYAPEGYRSVGPVRAVMYAGADYIPNANRTVLAIAMIETRQAVENLDEILTTPGLDGIYVGPSDLSVSFGHAAGFDPEFPEVRAAIEKIVRRCEAHGKAPGIRLTFPERVALTETVVRPGSDLIDGIVALWAALRAGDESRAYRIYLPSAGLIVLQAQGGFDGFMSIERYILKKRGVFSETSPRPPVSFSPDEVHCAEVDRLLALMDLAIGRQ